MKTQTDTQKAQTQLINDRYKHHDQQLKTLRSASVASDSPNQSNETGGDFRVGETWKRGDVLSIHRFKSAPGGGLSYPCMTVIASEDGTIGGWDVYDGQAEQNGKWTDVSFYGFSVI